MAPPADVCGLRLARFEPSTTVTGETVVEGPPPAGPVAETEVDADPTPSDQGDEENCAICISDIKPGDAVAVLLCGHLFHHFGTCASLVGGKKMMAGREHSWLVFVAVPSHARVRRAIQTTTSRVQKNKPFTHSVALHNMETQSTLSNQTMR